MEKELKTLLVILAKYIKTVGCEKAIFDFGYDGTSYYENKMRCNGEYINMPIEITKFLEQYLDKLPDFQGDADNGSEYHGYEMIFNPTTMTITTYGQYSEYGTEDGGSSSVEIDEEVMTQFEELISKGYQQPFYVDFSGGGDSGYIEDEGSDYNDKRFKLTPKMDDLSYRALSDFGGWEINEGSQGNIVFNLEDKNASANLTWNTENTETEVIDVWNLNK
jgi:hypothetical protein